MWTTISSYIWGEADEQVVPDCSVDDTQTDDDWVLVDLRDRKSIGENEKEVANLRAQVYLEESWYVTPPPCFEASGLSPETLETSPMEDLLIEHPSMSVYGPGLRCQSPSSSSSPSRCSSPSASEENVVDRREPRRTVEFQAQLELIEKRRQTEPPPVGSIRPNRKNMKKQNMVYQHSSRSKRNKKRNRMLGKHVGMQGKRGC